MNPNYMTNLSVSSLIDKIGGKQTYSHPRLYQRGVVKGKTIKMRGFN